MSEELKAFQIKNGDEDEGAIVVFHISEEKAYEKFGWMVDDSMLYDVERLKSFDQYIDGGEPREFNIEGNEKAFHEQGWWYGNRIQCEGCDHYEYDAVPSSILIECQNCNTCIGCAEIDGKFDGKIICGCERWRLEDEEKSKS